MTLGNVLKKIRQEMGLSQPELAEQVGIEQSYLSKLENDKSVPSNDIFRNLLSALQMDLSQFLANFELHEIRQNLTAIPDVEYWLKQQDNQKILSQRKYLYTCSAFIVFAVTLFYIGFSKQIFSEVRYQYESPGVILPLEPKDIFSQWRQLIPATGNEHRNLFDQKRVEMIQRRDDQIYLTENNLGAQFEMDVQGGTRLFTFDKEEVVPRAVNAWLQVLGVFCFMIGLMGFILERRFYR
ncbi:helix-turn-helix domain-containing protein [Colwelliaceae bacterium 6471]